MKTQSIHRQTDGASAAQQDATGPVRRQTAPVFIQRKCKDCEEEVRLKPAVSFAQQKSVGTHRAGDAVSNKIESTRGQGGQLPDQTRNFMEQRMHADFSNVRVHKDADAAQLSEDLNAHAFTVGNDIYFNEGKYAPESAQGQRLLAHELTHTLQQGGAAQGIQRDDKDGDKTYAPKPEFDFKLLPPDLQFKIFHLLLEADTSKVHLDYHTKTFMAGLSYQYGDALSFNLKYKDFTSKFGWTPGDNKFSLGFNTGAFNAGLSATPGQNKYGLNLHYGAPLLPYNFQMADTFNAGGRSVGNLVGGLPGGLSDPIGYYKQYKPDIENVTKTVDLVKKITDEGKTKIRFGADFSLSYDPVNKVLVTAKVGLLF